MIALKFLEILVSTLFGLFLLANCQETTTAFNFDNKCAGVSCPTGATAFYDGYTLYCWATDEMVTYCNGTDSFSAFLPYANQPSLPKVPCHGYINFRVNTNEYWINDTTLYKLTNRTTNEWSAEATNRYWWYTARFRPNEAKGWVFCSYRPDVTPVVVKKFYYDGNYWDVVTNVDGKAVANDQAVSQYSLPYFQVEFEEDGCQTPVCCWFQDYAPGSSSMTEFVYNATGFLIWQSNKYELYTGEFNEGIRRCTVYFGNASFTDHSDRTIRYVLHKGSVYYDNSSTVPSGNSVAIDFIDHFKHDPEATGFIYYRSASLPYHGVMHNSSGVYKAYIYGGRLEHFEMPRFCGDAENMTSLGVPGNPHHYCNMTENKYESFKYQICDPYAETNPCPNMYACMAMPRVYGFPSQCLKGLCMPDYYGQICPVPTKPTEDPSVTVTITTTTEEITTTLGSTSTTAPVEIAYLKKYMSECVDDTECFTGFCWEGNCICSNCTKVLPGIHYDMKYGIMTYRETCIPVNATVVGDGDACDMWSKVPSRYCGMGSVCQACPETWNSKYFQSTCIPFVDFMTQNKTCPNWANKCGYLANCTMLGGIQPVCTCPPGFNLENNLRDCYGWRKIEIQECNVTCGNGYKASKRYCEKKSGSTAICDGDVEQIIVEPCIAEVGACPINATMLPAAVKISFASKIVTTELFNAYAKSSIKAALANILNQACTTTADLYEHQCCPGKIYPSHTLNYDCINAETGILISNEYTDGSYFSFYLFAMGDKLGTCCASAETKVFTRKKRSTVTNHFDQDILVSFVRQQTLLDSMTAAIQAIDPSVVVTANSVFAFTTTTLSTSTTTPQPKVVLEGMAVLGLPAIASISSILAGLAGGLVLVVLICRLQKQKKLRDKAKAMRRGPLRPESQPELVRKSQVGTGDTQRHFMRGVSAQQIPVGMMAPTSAGIGHGYQDGTNTPLQNYDPKAFEQMLANMSPQELAEFQKYQEQLQQQQQQHGPILEPPADGNYPPYYGHYPQEPMGGNSPAVMMAPQAAHGY